MTTTTATVQEPRFLSYRARKILTRVLIYSLMALVAIIIIIPIIWMFSTSLKLKSQLFSREIHWIPQVITLDNYTRILSNPSTPIGRWFVNTLIVSTITTALVLVVDALAAYAYARLEFPGRRVLFTMLLATLFLPGVMFLVPNFVTVAQLGMLNKFSGVIIPALAGVFGVYFMRQFYETIPKELEEAAYIDGAGTFQTFLQVGRWPSSRSWRVGTTSSGRCSCSKTARCRRSSPASARCKARTHPSTA